MKKPKSDVRPLFLFLLLFLLATGVQAEESTSEKSPSEKSTSRKASSELGALLIERYETIGTTFWEAETFRLQEPETAPEVLLRSPVPETHPSHPKYFQAATAADSFLKLADENKIRNWMLDPVLYFGGISHFSLGNYARAETLLSRLSPDYLRDYYINDRDPVNPEFSTPTKPGISKLIFHCKLKSLPENPEDALAILKQITVEAQSTLAAQSEYAHWLANRKNIHSRRLFSESYFGGQPDQVRASALPKTLDLLEEAWDQLLPEAVKKGHLPVRDYLRTLTVEESTSGSPFEQGSQSTFVVVSAPRPSVSLLASLKLQEVDARIIRSYFSQAQRQLKANNFDRARRYYKRIISEYPVSQAATRAETELSKIVPVEVKFYRTEGDRNFKAKTQVGVPQSKAREFYAKMLAADREGPQADYAQLWLGRSLGTEGKFREAIAQLRALPQRFPDSAQAAQAAYLIGFYLGAQQRYPEAVRQLDRAAVEYAQTPFAAEALWFAAYFSLLSHQSRPGLAFLERLEKYPDSPRHRHIPELQKMLREPMP